MVVGVVEWCGVVFFIVSVFVFFFCFKSSFCGEFFWGCFNCEDGFLAV